MSCDPNTASGFSTKATKSCQQKLGPTGLVKDKQLDVELRSRKLQGAVSSTFRRLARLYRLPSFHSRGAFNAQKRANRRPLDVGAYPRHTRSTFQRRTHDFW
jgi:hypothetical protein